MNASGRGLDDMKIEFETFIYLEWNHEFIYYRTYVNWHIFNYYMLMNKKRSDPFLTKHSLHEWFVWNILKQTRMLTS